MHADIVRIRAITHGDATAFLVGSAVAFVAVLVAVAAIRIKLPGRPGGLDLLAA